MKQVSAAEAARLVEPGWTVACAGFVGAGHAEAVTSALEARFLAEGSPTGLTLVYSAGQGDRGHRGVNHFGHAGMTRRIIGGHWRSAPKLSLLATENLAEAYNFPQGVITHLYRAIAGAKPGVITRIGLHTFVDPRLGGGKLNPRTTEDLVEVLTIGGEDYLRYKPFRIDCALLRGTTADKHGNITTEHEPFHHELLAIAQAARNSGGIVIAQVKRVIDEHPNPQPVRLPGILVDYLVVCGDDPVNHSMTFGEYLNLRYTGEERAPRTAEEAVTTGAIAGGAARARRAAPPLDCRRIIQRRAVLELLAQHPRVVNLGVGMPAGVGAIAHDEGIDDFVLTVEAGPIGGTPADGLSFGASSNPQAIVDEPAQFDFYDGGGIDMAFLGLAELDVEGNVNVSLFGEGSKRILAGVGGFINITQATRSLVFMGSLTAGGLEIEAGDGRLRIRREGRSRKIVPRVEQLSFSGRYALQQGTRVLYLTERAVFDLVSEPDGRPSLRLIEVAPGIDVERDVLAWCAAPIEVARELRIMNPRIFENGPLLGR